MYSDTPLFSPFNDVQAINFRNTLILNDNKLYFGGGVFSNTTTDTPDTAGSHTDTPPLFETIGSTTPQTPTSSTSNASSKKEARSAFVISKRQDRGSLYNVILATSGYSNLRTGRVLSVLLSISYPDAVDLLESAPCTIAWDIPRDKALKIKALIEKTGADVDLVQSTKSTP